MSEILNKGLELGATPLTVNDSIGIIRMEQEIYMFWDGNRTISYYFLVHNNVITFSGSLSSTTHPNQRIADTPENRNNGYYVGFFILKDYLEKFVCKQKASPIMNTFSKPIR